MGLYFTGIWASNPLEYRDLIYLNISSYSNRILAGVKQKKHGE
jgi:hypothetical protein